MVEEEPGWDSGQDPGLEPYLQRSSRAVRDTGLMAILLSSSLWRTIVLNIDNSMVLGMDTIS
jgi:hypothetical protein